MTISRDIQSPGVLLCLELSVNVPCVTAKQNSNKGKAPSTTAPATLARPTGEKAVVEEIVLGIKRIKDREDLTVQKIAEWVGCSQPTVHAWGKGNVRITWKDAISLALLDPGTGSITSQEDLVNHWLEICGHEGRLSQDQIVREIKERKNLGPKLMKKVAEIKELARAKDIVNDDQFLLALSCYLGQARLKADTEKWQRQSGGEGTVAFIWRCGAPAPFPSGADDATSKPGATTVVPTLDDLCERLTKKTVQKYVGGFIEPPGMASSIEVVGFIQVNVDGVSAFRGAKQKLKTAVDECKAELPVGASSKDRFKVYVTGEKYPHPADCWLFSSAKSTFAVLVSESSELVRKMQKSEDPEIKSNPYGWCAQIVHLYGRDVIQNDYLAPEKIVLHQGGQVSPASDGKWGLI
jgi:DNA-binding transcriptional regulator YiaG